MEINSSYYAILPVQYKETAGDGWDVTDTNLITISQDQGKSWTYFDPASLNSEDDFYQMLPDLKGKMPWPKKDDYKFVPKAGLPQYGA